MNENFKKILIVIGVIAIYHYFFRSLAPTTGATDTTGDGIANDIRNGIDTISAPIKDAPIDVIQSSTPSKAAPSGAVHSSDSNNSNLSKTTVKVLQG
jgi:hypothetical protein